MTRYIAEIPTHYQSEHRTEAAAIRQLWTAEKAFPALGQVVMVETSGTHTSRTIIYPDAGTRTTRTQ